MYVCVCNAIKDTHVQEAIDDGAENVRQIFDKHGCKPECAKCVGCMRKVLDQKCNSECKSPDVNIDLIAAE